MGEMPLFEGEKKRIFSGFPRWIFCCSGKISSVKSGFFSLEGLFSGKIPKNSTEFTEMLGFLTRGVNLDAFGKFGDFFWV